MVCASRHLTAKRPVPASIWSLVWFVADFAAKCGMSGDIAPLLSCCGGSGGHYGFGVLMPVGCSMVCASGRLIGVRRHTFLHFGTEALPFLQPVTVQLHKLFTLLN